jgi:hypothetical protein
MLDLDAIEVEEIASALADQTDYEPRWLIDPRSGEQAFRSTSVHLRHGAARHSGASAVEAQHWLGIADDLSGLCSCQP